MTHRSSRTEELDLSLTGSQIGSLSGGSRPGSSKGLRRPNSLSDIRTAQAPPKKGTTSSSRPSSANRSHISAQTPPASHRSVASVSSISQAQSKKSSARSATADYLSLFDGAATQPKIKQPSASRNASKVKKPSANAVKVLWGEPHPAKAWVDSARSGASAKTDLTEPYNIFKPESARSSSDELSDIEHSLSQSISKLQSLQNQLAGEVGARNNTHSPRGSSSSQQAWTPATSGQLAGPTPLANNMTSQGQSPRAKASLSSMENSYQNIKHKVPVNQVRRSVSEQASAAEDGNSNAKFAATRIQRWWRRHHTRLRAGEAAMKRLLDAKRKDFEEQREQEQQDNSRKAEDRKRIREEKERHARQQAIQDLKRKRELHQEEVKRKAEEEIAFLQASGKITRTPARARKAKNQLGATKNGPVKSESPRSPGSRPLDSPPSADPGPPAQDDEQAREGAAVQNGLGAEAGGDGEGRLSSPSQAPTQSTLAQLYATLCKLEEEENFTARAEKKKSFLDDLDKATDESSNLTTENLKKLNARKDGVNKSGFLTDDKMRSIMNFLDEVQVSDRISEIDTEITRMNEELEKPVLLVPSGEELAQLEAAQAAASEVTNTVLSQRLELEEKRRTVSMLQKALNQQRELTIRHAKETEKEMKRRLDVQKDEYEEAIKRHLSFIDQLIDDKKNLTEKFEEMQKEIRSADKKLKDKVKALEESHRIELQKLREENAAAEKLRRERWIEEKTKRIKEMTVKGLEPEIQRLIAKHKEEKKKMQKIHEAELLQADERAAQRYIKMTEELRDQLAEEKAAACARERELAQQRYEKQLQQEEEAFEQQRRRLYAEIKEEKDRLAEQSLRQKADLTRLQHQLEDSHRTTMSALKEEFDKAREEQERRHTNETRELQEKLRLEKEAWEENYMKTKETWLLQQERELRSKVKADRDKEIEEVITRLEADMTTTRDECERTAENKIKRMRDKYEAEIKEMERSERLAVQRYNETKALMTEMEGENERLKVIVKQKDQEIADLKRLTDKMNEERGRVSDIIRQEFADRIVHTDEENKRIKMEISELRAKHRVELERVQSEVEAVKRQKDEEMEEVHKRVKQAIVKKEEVVNQLRRQYEAANKRADHLEGLLEQQRKQLLGK